MFFTSLVRFIPSCFIFFEAIVNVGVPMISFSVCLLVVYYKSYWFIQGDSVFFHIAEFLYHSFKNSGRIFGISVYICMYSIISVNRDSQTSFLVCIPLISFLLPYCPASASSTMFKISGDPGHPSFIPDFSGIASSLSAFRTVVLNLPNVQTFNTVPHVVVTSDRKIIFVATS